MGGASFKIPIHSRFCGGLGNAGNGGIYALDAEPVAVNCVRRGLAYGLRLQSRSTTVTSFDSREYFLHCS